jgi:rhamnose transport system substrate-binding protein
MPKSTGNPYFESCRRGAQEAADELGLRLLWDGPPQPDAGRQAEIADAWLRQGVRVIAVSVESGPRLAPVFEAARAQGVKLMTWDADTDAGLRDFTVVHARPESIAHALLFEVGRVLHGEGSLAAITSTLTASNQSAWLAEFKARLHRDYPKLTLVDVRACGDSMEQARSEALGLLESHPQLGAIVGFCSPAVPGAAQAVRAAQRTNVRITGVSLPSICRTDIVEGVVQSVVIWKTRQLGYLVAAAAGALARGELLAGATSFRAGRLGSVMVSGDEIRLGRCHIVTRDNLDGFD